MRNFAFLAFIFVILFKSLALRYVCCKPLDQLTDSEAKTMWRILPWPSIITYIILAPIGLLMLPFGLAMATTPLEPGTTIISLATSAILGLSFYAAWAFNIILVPSTYAILRRKNLTKGRFQFVTGYFAVTMVEYVSLLCVFMMLK